MSSFDTKKLPPVEGSGAVGFAGWQPVIAIGLAVEG
jgi:hypothetical protein